MYIPYQQNLKVKHNIDIHGNERFRDTFPMLFMILLFNIRTPFLLLWILYNTFPGMSSQIFSSSMKPYFKSTSRLA